MTDTRNLPTGDVDIDALFDAIDDALAEWDQLLDEQLAILSDCRVDPAYWRSVATVVSQLLHASGGKYALATLCIGTGQGAAMVLEKV
jgi:hypothetical protein